jgi:DNA-binding IclR family transcriptional regulator
MTRNELLLAALAEGERSTAELCQRTGLGERTCRNGLRHLISEGYAWSPERGSYRLTSRGRAIASELGPVPPLADPVTSESAPGPPDAQRTS